MSSNVEKRKLSELGVVDLRSELEKRDLDKTGLKQVLVERLQKALQDAGEDPAVFEFQVEKKLTKRPSTTSADSEVAKDKTEENGPDNVKVNNTKDQEKEETKEKKENSPKKEGEKKMPDSNEEAPAESDNLIQLTLDEQEENFQDEEEVDSTGKTDTESDKPRKEDAKNTSTNADTTKEHEDIAEKTEAKTHEGNSSSAGVSKSSSSSSSRTHRQNRNLWITNITQTTKATELKQVLSAHGKVIGAKVVINAKYPGACCYGYVTMDTIEDADNCIAKLNNTELNGKIIRIEKVRPDHMNMAKLDAKKMKTEESTNEKDKDASHRSKSKDHKEEDKKKDLDKEKDKKEDKDGDSGEAKRDTKRKSRDRSRGARNERGPSRSRSRPNREILTFDKIKEERERQRFRERERMLREESRRRREEAARQRDVDRIQRSEAARLDREREKLRFEREKLEREKAEIIRLERERQKVEREKLELEKLQLQRVKMRLQEEELRPVKRPAPFRREGSYEDRKRASTTSKRYDEPSGMRYQSPSVKVQAVSSKKFTPPSKDYKSSRVYDKRDSYSKSDRDYESKHSQSALSREAPTSITKYEGSSVFNISHERDARTGASAIAAPRIAKDSRYVERERDRSPHYRRSIPEHKSEVRPTHERSYEAVKERERNSSGSGWGHPNPTPSKQFSTNSMPFKTWSSKDSWRPDVSNNGDRWNSGSVPRGEPACPAPPSMENYTRGRFEYKPMRSIRKY